jgi:ribosomal protein S18 acetylase RimI-like enzyme
VRKLIVTTWPHGGHPSLATAMTSHGLRPARASDIAAMQTVRASVKENRLTSTVISAEDVRTAIEDTGFGWVVEEGGIVVGFVIGNVRTGNIWALFVHPDYERRGHGRRLHDTMVRRLFDLGLERLWLTTEPGTRAQRFYEAAGWRLTGTTAQGELKYELARS